MNPRHLAAKTNNALRLLLYGTAHTYPPKQPEPQAPPQGSSTRFGAFSRVELSEIHFALRMVKELPASPSETDARARLADEAWESICARVWAPL